MLLLRVWSYGAHPVLYVSVCYVYPLAMGLWNTCYTMLDVLLLHLELWTTSGYLMAHTMIPYTSDAMIRRMDLWSSWVLNPSPSSRWTARHGLLWSICIIA